MPRQKIAIIAPPFNPVPAKGQGGTERIIYQMTEGLAGKNYKITLFAAGNCRTSAEFVQIFKKPISKIKFQSQNIESSRNLRIEAVYTARVMQELLKRKNNFDVIFNHLRAGYIFLPVSRFLKTPVATILHLPIFEQLADFLRRIKQPNIITISNAQRKGFAKINYLATIHNGIVLEEFEFCPKPKDYFLYVGAMAEHKGPKHAILAAKKAGVNLILAGAKKREPYFSKEVMPLVDAKQIKYVGEVSGKKRLNLFKYARGFLFPIKWPEPFGLVMAEAMACGAPVIAYPQGATREVVKDKKTGFIVKNINEMADRIKNIAQIKRSECRKWIKQNFSNEKMIEKYEKVVQKLS